MTIPFLLCSFGLSACERSTPDDSGPADPNPARAGVDGGCVEPVPVDAYDDLENRWAFTDNVCVEEISATRGQRYSGLSLAGLRPAQPVDAIALRYCSRKGCVDGFTSGSPCGAASDPDRCRAAWQQTPIGGWTRRPQEALPSLESGVPMCSPGQERGIPTWGWRHLLVYSRGDEVGFLADAATLKDFLGTIDTSGEAALVASYGPGYWIDDPWTVGCGAPRNARSTTTGFELLVSRQDLEGCVTVIRHSVVTVSPAADIRELAYYEQRL